MQHGKSVKKDPGQKILRNGGITQTMLASLHSRPRQKVGVFHEGLEGPAQEECARGLLGGSGGGVSRRRGKQKKEKKKNADIWGAREKNKKITARTRRKKNKPIHQKGSQRISGLDERFIGWGMHGRWQG